MAAATAITSNKATWGKGQRENDGPYFSLNEKITESSQLGHEPNQEMLEQMGDVDPQLSDTWVIWEQRKQSKDKKSGVDYQDNMRETTKFSTVKEFWSCWNHIPQPSELLDGKKFVREDGDGKKTVIDSIAIFRKGIAPQWEDPQNCCGGHFVLALKPSVTAGQVDELWNNIVLGMISGAIEPADMLTGARLVDKLDTKTKPVLRVELWFNEMDESTAGSCGKVYDLRGSFERCLRIGLDGKDKVVTWSRTETKSHATTK